MTVDKTDCLVNKGQTKAGTNEMRERTRGSVDNQRKLSPN